MTACVGDTYIPNLHATIIGHKTRRRSGRKSWRDKQRPVRRLRANQIKRKISPSVRDYGTEENPVPFAPHSLDRLQGRKYRASCAERALESMASRSSCRTGKSALDAARCFLFCLVVGSAQFAMQTLRRTMALITTRRMLQNRQPGRCSAYAWGMQLMVWTVGRRPHRERWVCCPARSCRFCRQWLPCRLGIVNPDIWRRDGDERKLGRGLAFLFNHSYYVPA